MLLGIMLLGLVGRMFWNPDLVFTGSAPLKLPPVGFENLRKPGRRDGTIRSAPTAPAATCWR